MESTTTDIMGKLREIKDFEEAGLIRDPNGKIKLENIVKDSQLYLERLSETFGEIGEELSEKILSFANTAYISFFDLAFLKEKQDRSTKYKPEVFLEAAHRLSFEMPNAEKVGEFYDALASNLSQSTKFVYNLVVKDLCRVLDEAKGRSDYSREAFTGFALEVLAQALPYSMGKVEDKWSVFRAQFDAIKNKYFSAESQNKQHKNTKRHLRDINIGYILGLINEGTITIPDGKEERKITPAERFVRELDVDVCGIDFGGRKDGNYARITVYAGDLNAPQNILLDLKKGQKEPVKDFL